MKPVPVFDTTVETMWEYLYSAKNHNTRTGLQIISSDSLANVKKECRARGWKLAWITTIKGCFSYGQNLVDEYPYQPRY